MGSGQDKFSIIQFCVQWIGVFSAYIFFFAPEKSASIRLDRSLFHLSSMKCLFALITRFTENSLFAFEKRIVGLFQRACFQVLLPLSGTSLGPTPLQLPIGNP